MRRNHRTIGDVQLTDADRQLEATRSRASWIDVEDTVPRLARRPVRMSEHHDTEACRDGVEIELRNIVEHVDRNTVYLKHFGLCDLIGPFSFVVVAAHDGDRGQTFEPLDHLRIA